MKIFIKNMVCPRCIMAVEDILKKQQIAYNDVKLGEVTLAKNIDAVQARNLEVELESIGFLWVKDKAAGLVEKIKAIIINQVQNGVLPDTNLSAHLSKTLLYDYSYLSQLFNSMEHTTIEKYFIAQRTEKVKELLMYNELSLSQIADQLHYSSVGHLSNQFKKVTGLSPSEFRKKASNNKRYSIDQIPSLKS